MVIDINNTISLCGCNLHVFSISTNKNSPNRSKTYYQHRHPSLELHYALAGKCNLTCAGHRISIQEGMALLIPPETYHDVVHTEKNTIRLCVSFKISPSKTDSANTKDFCAAYNCSKPIVLNIAGTESQYILKKQAEILDNEENDPYKSDKLLSLFCSLLLELKSHITENESILPGTKTAEDQEEINFKIDSFLGTNFMSNNAKSRIASNLYVSPRQLQRIIRKNYGMSYREKLAETRLQIAVDLLNNSNMPIHKISEILGYSCSANFSAFIKRIPGKTPSQIRKEK